MPTRFRSADQSYRSAGDDSALLGSGALVARTSKEFHEQIGKVVHPPRQLWLAILTIFPVSHMHAILWGVSVHERHRTNHGPVADGNAHLDYCIRTDIDTRTDLGGLAFLLLLTEKRRPFHGLMTTNAYLCGNGANISDF